MIVDDDLRSVGFIEYKSIDSLSSKSIWINLTSKRGVLLIPNGDGAFIPYLDATLISDSLATMTPCVQITTAEELNQLMQWVNKC